ncbi:MAG: class I tRNA ligase family protein [Candidatus Nomurabacteria bacterium]|jgi:valyl-tRNA synthetase|nr:class I tRNA ligase family protein [Candidatus Nomurabacteria bacterium]
MKFTKVYEPQQTEPEIYAIWETAGVFDVRPTKSALPYSIVMPPPNANGDLHIGHGLTLALEDILTRFHRLNNYDTIYIPGADHAGFETWVVYEKALEKIGKTRFDYSRDELYNQVWNFVAEQRGNMELQIRALGASCDWRNSTFTLDNKVVKTVYATFKRLWDEGLIYRGHKIVNYCTTHQTSFADIEVTHRDEVGKMWDIAYPVTGTNQEIIVSTTRPETMLGDTAVAVNPKDARYANLVGEMVTVPIANRIVPIIADEYVDELFGTGVVKITPAHDPNDYEVGKRHALDEITVIGFDGRMNEAAGEGFTGLTVEEARAKIVEELSAIGLLRNEKDIIHSVGHCYKCDSIIEPLLKDQWFLEVKPLAERAVAEIEKGSIKFFPEQKAKELIQYYKNLKDWNLSRQIPWGIPIPAFQNIDHPEDWIFDERVGESEIEVKGKKYRRDEDTFDTWFSSGQWPFITTNYPANQPSANPHESSITTLHHASPHHHEQTPHHTDRHHDKPPVVPASSSSAAANSISPPTHQNAGISVNDSHQNDDILVNDPAQTAADLMDNILARYYPLSVMETGSDLLYAWVSRMIMLGLYATDQVPFKEVYLHGMVLDEHGKKMSKSKGNVLSPMEIIAKYGSDAFRLGIVASRSAAQSQAFSPSKVLAGRNLCNKLWNIARFVQEQAGDNYENPVEEPNELKNIGEDWIIGQLNHARLTVEKMLHEYRFSEAGEQVYQVIWNDVADWFIETQKVFNNISLMTYVLEYCLKLIHPFAPFLSENIWQNLSWTNDTLAGQTWGGYINYDINKAKDFEEIRALVTEIRFVVADLSTTGKQTLMYGEDKLIAKNKDIIQFLARLKNARELGQSTGLRLANSGREAWLDIDAKTIAKYGDHLRERIDNAQKEIELLEGRLANKNYLKKAPAELVEETRKTLLEKTDMLERLNRELEATSA